MSDVKTEVANDPSGDTKEEQKANEIAKDSGVDNKEEDKTDKVSNGANQDTKVEEEVKETNEAANGASQDTKEKETPNAGAILRQVEFYFGDFNLPRDKFLRQTIKDNEDGWVPMDVMLKFARLAKLSTDVDFILTALAQSQLIETDLEKKKIRRLPSKPLPEWNDDRKKEVAAQTVYLKGFDKEKTTLDEVMDLMMGERGAVHVQMRNYVNQRDGTKGFKGSIFVTFESRDKAEAFMAGDKLEYKGVELIRKWQSDYFEDKRAEVAAKRKERAESKKKISQAKEEAAKQGEGEKEEQMESLPKGSVLVVTGLGAETMREDIKETLNRLFSVDCDKEIAFVSYQKGESEAKLRYYFHLHWDYAALYCTFVLCLGLTLKAPQRN